MKNIKNITLLLLLIVSQTRAQVPLKMVVEHFTNTKCGVCASRNPAFYTNLNTQAAYTYLSIHPSSPYNTCVLSQQNTLANDARTNQYGIYGGTPRLVVNGNVVAANANYAQNAIFANQNNQQTPFTIQIQQQKYGNDSIKSRIVVRNVATHNYTSAQLFVGLAEDTVSYNGGNGEATHYNVLRKALTAPTGNLITLPNSPTDSVVFTATTPKESAWYFRRIYTVAILQQTNTKIVLQSNSINPTQQTIFTATETFLPKRSFSSYPNPVNDFLNVESDGDKGVLALTNNVGELVFTTYLDEKQQIDTKSLPIGVYFLHLRNEKGVFTQKIIKM